MFLVKMRIQRQQSYAQLRDHLRRYQHQPLSIRDAVVSLSLQEMQASYYRGLKTLRIIGMISPMLGLLGTILGIIEAFKVIAAQTGPVAPHMIADGLWEAMLSTAVGLTIALPALLAAHCFRHVLEGQLQAFCLQLNKDSLGMYSDSIQISDTKLVKESAAL